VNDIFRQHVEQLHAKYQALLQRQALLEIYVTIALGAPYNDFDTH
jgi:hypothetical protein